MSVLVQFLWLDNVAAIIMITAVVYDYLLVFSREIEHVWCKPWTWISILFILIRYLGLCWVFAFGSLSGILLPPTVIVSAVMNQVMLWAFEIFISAADLVMVLRVYAMWNRSKTILGALLFVYVPEVIIAFVFTGIYNTSGPYISVSTFQLLDVPLCHFSDNLPSPFWLYMIPHYILGPMLLILAIIQVSRQSFEMYAVTKKWQPNRYMKLLVREGTIYFFLRVLCDIVDAISRTVSLHVPTFFLGISASILLFSVLPRFIIGMREVYERDLSRRWQGIDTGFGVLSELLASKNANASTNLFTDVSPERDQVVEGVADDSEAIQLEAVGCQV